MRAPSVHHISIAVTDAEASAEWYQQLLGPARIIRREGPDWVRVRMQWPSGLVIGATQHGGVTVRIESEDPSVMLVSPDAATEGAIWRILNGHETGNCGHSQGKVPTLNLQVCHRGLSEYGRQREGMRVFGSPICCTR